MLSAGFGGAERLFVDVSLCLADRGHRVLVVCHPAFEALSELEHRNMRIYPLTVHFDWSYMAKVRLARAMREFDVQVIHSHLARGAAVAGAAGLSEGIPVAANLHNYVKLKYYRRVSHFIPGTEDQRQYLLGSGIPPERITVIPHFSRLAAVQAIERPDPHPGDTGAAALSYGRFVKKKGFHILVESIALLRETGLRVNLILGGDGPEKENLVRQIADLGLADQVSLYGWVGDIEAFLSQGAYFILPSLDEPFGIVLLEAMAKGKVIVSTTTQGPSEILDDTSAYLVSPGDSRALAEAIRTAIEAPLEAAERAQRAWDTYQHAYTPDVIVPIYEETFESIIG